MGNSEKKDFVESIQWSNLAMDTVIGLIMHQADPNELQVTVDPTEARAYRIYRELGNKGLVPLIEVNQDAVVSMTREAVLVAAEIANDESGLR